MVTPLTYLDSKFQELAQEASSKRTFLCGDTGLIFQQIPSAEELKQTLLIYDFMKYSWPLPKIAHIDYENFIIAMQDAGKPLTQNPESYCFDWAYAMVCAGHTVNLPRIFTTERVDYEVNLYKEWFCQQYLGIGEDRSIERLRSNYLAWFSDVPLVATHLDFHSANILVTQSKQLFFIDYQDALMGPYLYDGVCLLEDAYHQIDHPTKIRILRMMARLAKTYHRSLYADYQLCAQQRLVKMVGIFTRLALRDRKYRYLSYIAPLLKRLLGLASSPEEKRYFANIMVLYEHTQSKIHGAK